MRARDLGIGLAVVLALALYGFGALKLGQALGRPGSPDAAAAAEFPIDLQDATGGLFGFEGQGDRLQAGPWGEVVSIEDALVTVEQAEGDYVETPGKRLVLRNGDGEHTLDLSDERLLRALRESELAEGDRVAVGDGAVLVIR